jgi:hypothetical protein
MNASTHEKLELRWTDGAGLRDWALRRGFVENQNGVLVAPYGDVDVRIIIKKNNITVEKVRQGKVSILVEGPVGKDVLLFLDQFDMVHGIGIFTRFYTAFQKTGVRPCWFPDGLVAHMENTGHQNTFARLSLT